MDHLRFSLFVVVSWGLGSRRACTAITRDESSLQLTTPTGSAVLNRLSVAQH